MSRCDRRLRGAGIDWACGIALDDDHTGVVDEFLCPGCITAEEHTTREVNDATTDYIWIGDRVQMWPKTG